jgi:hypothetical protein
MKKIIDGTELTKYQQLLASEIASVTANMTYVG